MIGSFHLPVAAVAISVTLSSAAFLYLNAVIYNMISVIILYFCNEIHNFRTYKLN